MAITCPDLSCAGCGSAAREVQSYCWPCQRRRVSEGQKRRAGLPCAKCSGGIRAPKSSYCRPCKNAAQAEAKQRRGGDVRLGHSPAELDELRRLQGGRCDICRDRLTQDDRREHFDHDHATGQTRGLLCRACNIGLGYYQDRPEVLRAAAAYVERWR